MSKKTDYFNFDLKQLRSYLETIRENSFTRASRNLKIGQATISNHINQLEKAIGAKLIDRTSTKFSVTPQGEVLKAFCEKLFSDLDRLRNDLDRDLSGGITRIAASTIAAAYILPDQIAKARKNNPDFFYKIEISDSRETVEMVREGKAEAGITGRKIIHPALTYEKILTDEIVLIAPADYPDKLEVQGIKELPLIDRENGSGTKNAWEKALSSHNILPSDLNIVFQSSTSEGVKEAVVSGIGAAFISGLAVKNELKLGLLKIIPVKDMVIKRDFFAVYQSGRQPALPAGMIIDQLRGGV